MVNEVVIPELNTRFVFRERPEAIPGDLRPLWRIGLVLLILHLSSRGGKSSFGRLHVLNWALRSIESQNVLLGFLDGQFLPGAVVVRIEPSLNQAVDFAHGEGLIGRVLGDRIELTSRGEAEAKRLVQHGEVYQREKQFLKQIGKTLTEKVVKELFSAEF